MMSSRLPLLSLSAHARSIWWLVVLRIYLNQMLLSLALSKSLVSPFLANDIQHRARGRRQPHRQWRSTRTARFQQMTDTSHKEIRTAATEHDISQARPTVLTFTSPPQQVYIEDTDAYGVMYHSNYLRAYDRALQQFFATKTSDSTSTGSSVSLSSSWSIVKVLQHRFKSSPPLGGTFCVTATRNDNITVDPNDVKANTEVWDMSMWNANDPNEAYNTATVILCRHHMVTPPSQEEGVGHEDADDALVSTNGNSRSSDNDDATVVQDRLWYNIYRDEWDMGTPHIPLRTVLNLFERSRTTFLGGPDRLRQLQVDHDLLFVVTSIDPCFAKILPTSTTSTSTEAATSSKSIQRHPTSLLVQTTFVPKRRGRIIECRHRLLAAPHDSTNKRTTDNCDKETMGDEYRLVVAEGVITIWALQESTRRPATKPFPDWLQAKMKLTHAHE